MIERQRQTDQHIETVKYRIQCLGLVGIWGSTQGQLCPFPWLKKVYKNKEKKLCCMLLPTQPSSFKLLNTKICFDIFIFFLFFNSAASLEPLPGVHLPGSRNELQLKPGDDSHAELTDAQCFKQLQAGVHSSCKAFAGLSLWLLLADPGSSCYVLRLLQICSGVLLWSDE